MIQRVVGPAMQGAAWAWEAVLLGISRIGLEAIDFWGRFRAHLRRALRRPRFPALSLPAWLSFSRFPRRHGHAAAGPDAAAVAGASTRSRVAAVALDLALAGTALYVIILMHREIYAQMQALPSYRVRLEELRMAHRPAWAPQETLTVALPIDASLARQARGCDPELVPEVAKRLEREPWVRRVGQVRRVYPDRLEARVELRRPAACVLRGTRTVYVDPDGVRLPDLRGGTSLPAGCCEVAGVDGPPPAVGARWEHPGVRGALDVIQALDAYRVDRVLLVSRIDVSNIGGRRNPRESEVICWTAAGVPVAWGRPALTVQFGENPVEVKMKHLALALEAFPSLRGLERVDLRFDRVVVRPRPEWRVLASAPVPAPGPAAR